MVAAGALRRAQQAMSSPEPTAGCWRWHVSPLTSAAGRSLRGVWASEIEMWLAALPFNAAREKRGQAADQQHLVLERRHPARHVVARPDSRRDIHQRGAGCLACRACQPLQSAIATGEHLAGGARHAGRVGHPAAALSGQRHAMPPHGNPPGWNRRSGICCASSAGSAASRRPHCLAVAGCANGAMVATPAPVVEAKSMMARKVRTRASAAAAQFPEDLSPLLRRIYAARNVQSGAELATGSALLPVGSLMAQHEAAALLLRHAGASSWEISMPMVRPARH